MSEDYTFKITTTSCKANELSTAVKLRLTWIFSGAALIFNGAPGNIQGKGVSEWLSLMAFLGTADIGVHIVHTSRKIIAYTLESLSLLTQIPHNLQATINFKKKDIKKETQQSEGPHWFVIGDENSTSVYNDPKYLTSSLTETEPQTAITNQPEESEKK